MIKWGLIFLVIAIIAGLLGFTGVAGAASTMAKIIFGVGLVIFVILLLLGRSIVK